MSRSRGQAEAPLSVSIEALHVGSIIDGRYEVLDILGEGGFGVVYKARQIATDQLVALKVLVPTKITNKRSTTLEMRRFEREIRLIARLQHPNIVRLLDAGRLRDGRLYMALELIKGEELSLILDREGRLSAGEATYLMRQVLDALSAAHRMGIVHRDLKPQNIMVTTNGARRNAMVVDFGIGTIIERANGDSFGSLTLTGQILGTPSYMAPEQLRGEVTTQSDIYAWGLVFYECLTGRRAVYAQSVYEVIHRQLSPELVPIPPPLLATDVGRLIYYATTKELEHRYPNVEAVHHALEACEIGAPSLQEAIDCIPPPIDQPPRHEPSSLHGEDDASFDYDAFSRDVHALLTQARGGASPGEGGERGARFHGQATRAHGLELPATPRPRRMHDLDTRTHMLDVGGRGRGSDAPTLIRDPEEAPLEAASAASERRAQRASARRSGSGRAAETSTAAHALRSQEFLLDESRRRAPPRPQRPRSRPKQAGVAARRRRGAGRWVVILLLLCGAGAFAAVRLSGMGRSGASASAAPLADDEAARTRDESTLDEAAAAPLDAAAPVATPPAPAAPVNEGPLQLLEVAAREVTLGLSDAERRTLLEEERACYENALCSRFDLDFGVGVVEARSWTQPGLLVLATEVTWEQWQTYREHLPALEDQCPEAFPEAGEATAAVTQVGAREAAYFCKAIGMRLPTAREWEALARGPQGRAYAFGDALTAEQSAAWTQPHAPGTRDWSATPEGVRDLSGGVREWVRCEEHEAPEGANPDYLYCARGYGLRGGSWKTDPFWGQAFLMGLPPREPPDCHRAQDIGFRCVKPLPP